MQLTIQEVSIAFLASFSLSVVLTLIFRKIAIYLGIVDKPNQQHKTHTQPVPYLGGLSIVITVLIGLSLSFLFNLDYIKDFTEIIVIVVAPLLLTIVGLIDDLRNLGTFSRLLVQSLSALFVALMFIEFGWFGEPTNIQALNLFMSVFWIVGITNALNFIDNLDGGAGGIVVIASMTLVFAAIMGEQLALASLAILITGATFGFLVWNLHPARIYLGDAGALFLGSILAVLSIRLDPPTANLFSAWIFCFTVFAVPILDTAVALVSRILRGVSPLQGGKDHLSHILLHLGLSKREAAASIWLLQVFFSALGLILLVTDLPETMLVNVVAGVSWLALAYFFLRRSPTGL